ncbi:MAG TPA: cob(I)yrinic acid a,c-diamide adenosyltransferase [Polyangiaceae bacterium]
MRIYTGTGDQGTTGLFGGARVEKDDARVEAYGAVDELNACLGVAAAHLEPGPLTDSLAAIQADLFTLGAELGCVPGKEERLGLTLIGAADAHRLEGLIDELETHLEPLKTFILPDGAPAAAFLHQARTVCRRAERRVVAAGRQTPIRAEVLIYLNRLSDLLFVIAREANRLAAREERAWSPRR